MDEAKQAAKTVLKLSNVQAFVSFIDESTTESTYLKTIKNFEA